MVAAQYCQEQLAWLRELKKSDEWKTATWRIGCCHYGTRTGNDWNFACFRETFGDELNEAGNSLDLMLCGHEHYYARNDAHSTEIHHNFKYDSDRRKSKPPQFKYLSDKWNFTEVCGGLGEGACLEVRGRELTFDGLWSFLPAAWHEPLMALSYMAICWLFLYYLYRKDIFFGSSGISVGHFRPPES